MEAIRWDGSLLQLLDQRRLPQETLWRDINTWEQTAQAIADMVVRGAPAIGLPAG